MTSTALPRIVKWLLKTCFRLEVRGTYRGGVANGQRSTLVIANHTSFLDGVLLALFLPETPVFVVNTEIAQHPFYRFFLRYVDYLTVDPMHPMSMKKIVNLLAQGKTVAIFPEGRVSNTGALMKVYAGAAFAATKAQATVIPVHIAGTRSTYFSRVKGLFRPRCFPQLRLTILPPEQLPMDASLPARQRRNAAKEKLQGIMQAMQVSARQPMSLYQQLLDASQTFGKHKLVYEDGLTNDLSYADLINKSRALSVLLRGREMSLRVGVLLPNSNPSVITFYALQYLNKVPAMLNFTAGLRAVRAGLTACECNTIVTSRQFIDKANLQTVIAQLSDDYHFIYLEDLRQQMTLKDKLHIVAQRLSLRVKAPSVSPDSEAVVLFTSGSEGLPKGVVHSHHSMLTNVAQIQAVYDFSPADKLMICLPMFHVFGLAAGALLPVATGAGAFLYPNPLHYRAIPEVIYDRDCTVLLSTSTFLQGYARFADPYDFHCLRYVIAGAEKLSDEVIDNYHQQFGIRIMEGYGTTETAPVIAVNSQMAYQRGSVGKLLPAIRAQLVPVAGIDGGGKLLVQADNVMLGYLRADNPGVIEAAPRVANTRQYDTGDIVEIDAKGFVYIKGREKRFAKIAGEMVSLDSVEKLAAQASSQHQHAVIQQEDAKKGERLLLVTTDADLTRAALQAAAQHLGMPELAVPRHICVVKSLPVFSSGKTNYPALAEQFAEVTA